MTAFHPVYVAMYDHAFAGLPRSAQVLEFYLRTGPQRASEGLFRFNVGAAGDDLGMTRGEILAAISELENLRRPFQFDLEAGVVLDLSALRDNPLGKRRDEWDTDNRGPRDKRIKGAINKLKSLPRTRLLRQLFVVAGNHSPELAEAMMEELSSSLEAHEAPSRPMKPREERSSEEERRVGAALSVDEIASEFNAEVVEGVTKLRPRR